MNPLLERLQPYPFEKIRTLLAGVTPAPGLDPISLAIGEPRHNAPPFTAEVLNEDLRALERYPSTQGSVELRLAIADWLIRRFRLNSDRTWLADQALLPVGGTREALFAVAQSLLNAQNTQRRYVLMPNPFYQIYEGAALLAGLEPHFYAAHQDVDESLDAISDLHLSQAQMLYLCNPGNPSGSVATLAALRRLHDRAQEHGVILISDECYCELWRAEAGPPPGLLDAAREAGNESFNGCLVMHSLSKRSNLPGLRSGFVAGDPKLIAAFQRYRTYHGVTLPLPVQALSARVWQDEAHVEANRSLYDTKYQAVVPRLQQVVNVQTPAAGFYLWPDFGIDDTVLTRRLYAEQALSVVPGQYLARDMEGHNPGFGHLRLALVAELEKCVEAAERIVHCLR